VKDSMVPLSASLYQALFEAMVANHKVADTEPLLKQMRQQHIELTPYIANTLIHGWAAENNIDKAQAIYDTVGRDKREPSTYEAMTRAFLSVEQRDEAKGVVGEMLTRGYPSAVVNKVLELLGGGQEQSHE
jgi:lipopolysaccharide biosynthesis regulator YciM